MKKIVFFHFIMLLPFFLHAQDKVSFLDTISRKLELIQQKAPLEKVYIQTDKEIYAPGEIIWFSGYVLDRSENQLSGYSTEIIVSIYDASGNFLMGDKFWVTNGKTSGDFLLPTNVPLGKYYLSAFSPFQDENDNIFVKPLIIRAFYESEPIVSFSEPEKIYLAGSKAEINLDVSNYNQKKVDKFVINYELRHNNRKLAEGKTRAEAGKAVIQATLPSNPGNEPVELFISHPKNLWTKKLCLKTSADLITIQFYVEGNNLTGTIPQKTGFYATSQNGLPVDLEADILDGTGQILVKTKTFSPGYGIFPLKARPGEKWKLVITSEYGKGQQFDLPQTGKGPGLAITNVKTDNDFIVADLIIVNPNPQKLACTATRGYKLLWAANMEATGNARIKIPTADLGTGIVNLSVFYATGEFLSSRLVFVPAKTTASLNISEVNTEFGKVRITLNVKDKNSQPTPAGIIISIADTIRKVDDGNSLKGTVYLTSELENPPYEADMLMDDYIKKSIITDYFLICNELKNFSWADVLTQGNPAQSPDMEGHGFSGRVTDKKGNPVPHANINIINKRSTTTFSVTTDEKGAFSIPGFQPVDIKDLNISVEDENGKGGLRVIPEHVLSEIAAEKVRIMDLRTQGSNPEDNYNPAYLTANPGLLIQPPVIRNTGPETGKTRQESYKTMLESGSSIMDVIKSIKPYSMVNGQIVFSGMINSLNFQSGALIVIDGQKMGTQADALNNISPYDIDKINVSTDPMEILRYSGLNNVGLIEITTKRGGESSPASAIPVKKENLYTNGYRIPRNFLTTDALAGETGRDLRTTLYWIPDLEIGTSGTITFSIPFSMIKSGFLISAEGITTDGAIVLTKRGFNVR
jgi:hypothetical protein